MLPTLQSVRSLRTLSIIAICIGLVAAALIESRAQQARSISVRALSGHSASFDKGGLSPEGATITVNSLSDAANVSDGLCTLREAITAANNNAASGAAVGECAAGSSSGADAIDMTGLTGTINLTGALPDISSSLTITGPGSGQLTVRRDTGGDYRIFSISNTTVSMSGLTVTNGKTPDADCQFFGSNCAQNGGGIRNSGSLTLIDIAVVANRAGDGAGIALNSSGIGNWGGGISNSGTLTMTNSAVTGNAAGRGVNGGAGGSGGGITNSGSAVTLTNCTIIGNSAGKGGNAFGDGRGGNGGGIYSISGTITLNNVNISNNSAGDSGSDPSANLAGHGGGIYVSDNNQQVLILTNSTVSGNHSGIGPSGNGFGGGIFSSSALVIVNGSTISGNVSAGPGGGLINKGSARFVNSTISGNTAQSGGGIFSDSGTLTELTNCTVSENSAASGSGIITSGGPSRVRNSIIAGNGTAGSSDLNGSFTTQGHNLIGKSDGSSGFTNGSNGDQVGTIASPLNAQLGPLANNGGPNQTRALLSNSPALDAGDNCVTDASHCSDADIPQLITDQRGPGFSRASDGNNDGAATVDIGAFEAQKIVVTNTNDSGAGSLRQAILDANANPGADTITFNIPGAGVHTITPASPLPAITDQVLVDGYTQPGASRNTLANGDNAVLLIELNGTVIGGSSGLTFRASNSEVRGLVINRFAQGIFITGSSGTTQTTGILIQGNFIGTNAIGNSSLPNGEGISIEFSNHDQIGGTTPDARNLISGNSARGVDLSGTSSAITIQGNFLGTDASGKLALFTPVIGGTGILAAGGSGSHIIGGTGAGSRNIISGNHQAGIQANSSILTIQGNYIGTDVTGTVAVRNGFGVWVNSFQAGVITIGGTASGASNLISGNELDGVFISGQSSNVQVLGNLIGTEVTGTQALGNKRNGVQLTEQAVNNKVGGVLAGEGNIIAFNAVNGVLVTPGVPALTGNSIRGNSIFSNGAVGIDLGGDGVTPNDAGDGDTGPNNIQNFPVLTRAVTGVVTAVQGTLNTTPNSSGVYFIDFYTTAGCDGIGQGRTYLGSVTTAKTDANGNVAFTFNPTSLPLGAVVTATATDGSGNTSEFSDCKTIQTAVPGTLQFSAANYPSVEGDSGTHALLVTVTRAGGRDGAVSVHYATTDGTATTGNADYDATSGDLTWPDGDNTSRTFNVVIHGDVAFEPNETINMALSNAQLASLGSPSAATVTITNDDAQGGFISFSQANYPVTESAGFVTITVNRTNDVSRAATVDYATDDTGAPAACGTVNGLASSRCDFTRAAGTLTFGAGEVQKTFTVLMNRDTYVESSEMFTVNLSNATAGAILATPFSSTVTINDDNSGLPANAIDDAGTFVRMHYHDFLNREADQAGLDFWTGQMTNCGNADLTVCRVNVSGAFFLSIEFQQTGYLVERMYKTGYGDAVGISQIGGSHQIFVPVVRANEFLADTQRVGRGVIVNQGDWQTALENNKQAYALEFVQTSRFITAFPTSMTPAQFVDKLNTNAGGVLSVSERQAVINLFGNSVNTTNVTARAQALRQVADDTDLQSAEFNRAFVLTQYIGYLRRNPNDAPDSDYTGYDFWLGKLNQFNGNFVAAEMVKAFISADEYRKRLGSQ